MKNYIKPDIMFQTLALSTDVSAGCAIISNKNPGECAVAVPDYPGLTVFPEGTCVAYVPGYEDQVCYHVPIADMNVFES